MSRFNGTTMRLNRVFLLVPALCLVAFTVYSQTNFTLRVMSANLTSGNNQSYETAGIDIFQGLKPDVVAIQEFRYNSSSSSNDLRTLVDMAFGTNYNFFCQSGFNIPNGVVSRYPIVAAGSWTDSLVSDRSFVWAQIHLPGTNDLYVVSVHLYSSGTATDRNTEATTIKTQIQANFPTNAWVIVAGDFNTTSRSEACVTTFKTFLSDSPVPADNSGDQDTNEPRSKPYDYVLASFALTNTWVPSVIGAQSFNGLVFDSAVFTPLSDVSPVVSGDSHVTGMQHMAVIKDFYITASATTNVATTNPPSITTQPQGQTNVVGASVAFSVGAGGTSPLSYQWSFNGTNLAGVTGSTLRLTNAQTTASGSYWVVITNYAGSMTSSPATLLITNAPPAITAQPQAQSVAPGLNATFSVAATGTAPLAYQWVFNGTNISGATTNPLVVPSVTSANAGNYYVIVTNYVGSVTSAAAALSVVSVTVGTNLTILAQWNFNSPTADGSTSTGSTTPSIGSGTASLIGGVTAVFVGGDAAFDPASTDNSGWNTSTYPAQGTGNKTRGPQFAVSTLGVQNVTIVWSSQSSGTGSKYGRLQYSTNGTDFVDAATAFTNAASSFTVKTNSLANFIGVNNNASFAFRFVSEFESTAIGTASANYAPADSTKTYGTAGTMRYDMVTVLASALVTNPVVTAPTLGTPLVSAGVIQMAVTGTAGASYIIQTSTNLGSTWMPVQTNTAPFSFNDSDFGIAPQKFYRAVSVQ